MRSVTTESLTGKPLIIVQLYNYLKHLFYGFLHGLTGSFVSSFIYLLAVMMSGKVSSTNIHIMLTFLFIVVFLHSVECFVFHLPHLQLS